MTVPQTPATKRDVHATRLETILDNISVGLCMYDAGRRLLVSNPSYARVYGLAPETVQPGMTLTEILALRSAVGAVPDMPIETYMARAEDSQSMHSSDGTLIELMNGRTIMVRYQAMADGGSVMTHTDVTERRRNELRLMFLAHHDPLTGLPNRAFLRQRLERILATCDAATPCAVICLGLDRLRDVNDTLGHDVGDEVLRTVVLRIAQVTTDSDVVARVSDNEFAIVRVGMDQATGAPDMARAMIERLVCPFQANGQQFIVGACIGIATAPRDGNEADHLLRDAALALSAAKALGNGRIAVFAPTMHAAAQRRRMLETDLHHALAEDELELAFQPVASLKSGRIGGFEALLRWNRPPTGRVSPAEFIPIAEQNGLIVPIGAWVLHTACAEAARWPDGLTVAVNVSATQFQAPGLLDTVSAALRASGLPPRRLELEITESAMMRNWQETATVLQRLKRLGVRISMDDFGTGYSSLSYLRRFPFDKIKIDQSFVRELTGNTQTIAIVRSILALCRALGMTTTAEGVETQEQFEILAEEGCAEIQGYLLSPPRPAPEIPGSLPRLNAKVLECLGTGGGDVIRRPVFAAASGARP